MTSEHSEQIRKSDTIDLLVFARLMVARLGESDLYSWWRSDGLLSEDGAFVGSRVLPLTHGSARARIATAVARFACEQRHPDPTARNLFRLDASIEDQVDSYLVQRLNDLSYWNDVLAQVKAVASDVGIAEALRDAGIVGGAALAHARNRGIGPGGRSVSIETGATLSETVTSLAAAFILSRPGELVVPYLQADTSA